MPQAFTWSYTGNSLHEYSIVVLCRISVLKMVPPRTLKTVCAWSIDSVNPDIALPIFMQGVSYVNQTLNLQAKTTHIYRSEYSMHIPKCKYTFQKQFTVISKTFLGEHTCIWSHIWCYIIMWTGSRLMLA